MPALPGAHHICLTRGDCASFHTSACSRPPEPITRSFIVSTTYFQPLQRGKLRRLGSEEKFHRGGIESGNRARRKRNLRREKNKRRQRRLSRFTRFLSEPARFALDDGL